MYEAVSAQSCATKVQNVPNTNSSRCLLDIDILWNEKIELSAFLFAEFV